MWPRRKVLLVASPAAVGIEGVRAVLKELGLGYSEADPAGIDSFPETGNDWLDQPLERGAEESGTGELVTELIFWPEVSEDNVWRARALALGLKQQSVQSFLHSMFEDEVLLGVSEPAVLIEGCPLLGYILDQAGFEPSILWPGVDGKWQVRRKQGLHWVLPDSWLQGIDPENRPGRKTGGSEKEAAWAIREGGLDFYRDPEGRKFAGRLPRWPEPAEEEAACQSIAKCLDLGISWLDIILALSFLWENITSTDNLRWDINDFGWNGGTSGEKLSAASIDNVENWWSG